MDYLPAVELLDATHTFPGRYTFKAIGRYDDAFVARIVGAVRDELDAETDPPYKLRTSSGGRHVSVSLEPEVESPEQVLAVYRRIGDVPGLLYVF